MSGHSQFALLKTKRFLPLFIAQSIGAFNDNVYRSALSMLFITIVSQQIGKDAANQLNTLSAACLILPFFRKAK